MAGNNQDPTMEEILALANSPAEQRRLLDRIWQARALRNKPRREYSTWAGALLGGVGDILDNVNSSSQEKQLLQEADKQSADTTALRGRVLKMALGGSDPEPDRIAATVTPKLDATAQDSALRHQRGLQQERGNATSWQGSPPSNYPAEGPTGSSTGSNSSGLVGELVNSYEPSPRDRAGAIVAALRRNPRQLATIMAASGDPVLGSLGEMQRHDMDTTQAAGLREREHDSAAMRAQLEYLRGRRDKLSDTDADHTFQAEEHRLNRVSQERAARLSAGQRLDAEKRAASVPGMEAAEDASPTPEDAKKVKASLASAERMKNYIAELRKLHTEKGTEYGGPEGNRMQALTQQIRLEAKNIGELGALSGPDMGIVENIAQADPGSFTANVKGVFGVDNTQGSLDGLEKWVNDTLTGNMSAYGFRKKGQNNGGASVDDVLKAFGR